MSTTKRKRPPDKWATMGNDVRKRPMVAMTVAASTLAAIDAMKGTRGRGEVVDELVAAYRRKPS